jgi:hypothetical protein
VYESEITDQSSNEHRFKISKQNVNKLNLAMYRKDHDHIQLISKDLQYHICHLPTLHIYMNSSPLIINATNNI